jgi:hypothetical protein
MSWTSLSHLHAAVSRDLSVPACIGDALECGGGGLRKLHGEATSAEVVSKLLSEQNLDIRLVINHENEPVHARSPDLIRDAPARAGGLSEIR